ncbi:hypothetical protein [Sphingomonas jatrophae]|uniref:Uncharacterized protein n=1 Tax=Sphingomonas jatrophae TaxID=1166337 RepID=A0A1I6L5V3_9SPHN|nr:hypothetical protein [Sphingomonas jatrophae]SFR98863.1 hypothetical protein SAMN05192580_2341 [Sphingomonas jatrophae]
MMAALALFSAQAGVAVAQPAQNAPVSQRIESRQGDPVARGLPLSDPRLIAISLAALTTFILGFIAAVKGRGNGNGNGGQPVSP